MTVYQKLNDNFTNGFVTMTDLKYLVTSVFREIDIPLLQKIGSYTHPSGQSNTDFHSVLIANQIEKVYSSKGKKDFVLSRISLAKTNHINIDMHVQKTDNKIQFYLVGSDLKYYFMFLPKVGHYPHTGTSNSKWYGYESKSHMIKIAIGLKLIEIMLFSTRINQMYDLNSTGILGLEVQFDIPDKYIQYQMLSLETSIRSSSNPIKMHEGIFIYGKNGINTDMTDKMILMLNSIFSHTSELLFPTIIKNYDLVEFNSSPYTHAICSWNHHARILVKIEGRIMIIDPWMKYLPRVVRENLTNSNIKIGFFSRNQKDQSTEGSCVFCVFARVLFMIDSTDSVEKNISKPIPDFYAYLVKIIYNLTK